MQPQDSSTSTSSTLTSTKCIPHDFPPLPKCFLHLLNNEPKLDGQTGQSFDTNTHTVSQKNFDKMVFKSESAVSTATATTSDGSGSSSASTVTESAIRILSKKASSGKATDTDTKHVKVDNLCNKSDRAEAACADDQKKRQVLGKLNSSLSKLKREMTDLRSLDVTLLFQLLSLHEAIQDFKMTVWDRYSETGSEYSLETASYMGSMSSLSEEDTDWLEGLQSQSSMKGLDDSQVFDQSTSSLLDQITALVKRADADF